MNKTFTLMPTTHQCLLSADHTRSEPLRNKKVNTVNYLNYRKSTVKTRPKSCSSR